MKVQVHGRLDLGMSQTLLHLFDILCLLIVHRRMCVTEQVRVNINPCFLPQPFEKASTSLYVMGLPIFFPPALQTRSWYQCPVHQLLRTGNRRIYPSTLATQISLVHLF